MRTGTTVHHFPARDGRTLAYRELGTGRPLVLLHGFTGSGTQWTEYGPGEALAAHGHRVIVPDLRGHGDSAAPDDPRAYPPDVLAEDGLALLDRLGLTGGDYDLGGISLGGRIVLRLLARGARPSRAVVAGQGLEAVTRTADSGAHRRVLSALTAGEPLAPGSAEAEQARWIIRSGNDPRALRHVLDSHVATGQAELARITVPVLVLTGDRDPAAESAGALAAALSHGHSTRVPGSHVTALGAPEFAAAMLDFLDQPSR